MSNCSLNAKVSLGCRYGLLALPLCIIESPHNDLALGRFADMARVSFNCVRKERESGSLFNRFDWHDEALKGCLIGYNCIWKDECTC